MMAVLADHLNDIYSGYSSKEQEDMTYYVVNRLRRHFKVLGPPEA